MTARYALRFFLRPSFDSSETTSVGYVSARLAGRPLFPDTRRAAAVQPGFSPPMLSRDFAGSTPASLPPLRPYQRDIIAAVQDALQTKQRTLVVAPTATGKTRTFLELAMQSIARGGRVLILVPAHLVGQVATRAREAGIRTDTEKADKKAEQWIDCVVASVDTLSLADRLGRWDPENFQLLIVDEAHHGYSPTWQRVIDYFELAKIVGFTATPDRLDCKPLVEVFQDVCFEYTIKEAIQDGFLAPIDQKFIRVEGLDFTEIRQGARDLDAGDLDALMNNERLIKMMAESTVKVMRGRRTVIFCTSVSHAYAYADCLRSLGVAAAAIDGQMRKRERKQVEDDFVAGRISFLTNVGCLAEGWDCPPVDGIVMARKTMSRALYTQQLGRGLRLHPGKTSCLVLDFVGNSQHRLVHAAHVIDPNIDDRAADRAADLREKNPDLTLEEAVQLAIEQIDLEDASELLRKRVTDGRLENAEFETVDIDPFDESQTAKVFALFDMGRVEDRWERDATPKQIELLKRFGVNDPEVLNRLEASKLIEKLTKRRKKGRATLRQVRKLVQAGTHPKNALAMSFDRARQGIDELAANNWRRPPWWGPRQTEPDQRAIDYLGE